VDEEKPEIGGLGARARVQRMCEVSENSIRVFTDRSAKKRELQASACVPSQRRRSSDKKGLRTKGKKKGRD